LGRAWIATRGGEDPDSRSVPVQVVTVCVGWIRGLFALGVYGVVGNYLSVAVWKRFCAGAELTIKIQRETSSRKIPASSPTSCGKILTAPPGSTLSDIAYSRQYQYSRFSWKTKTNVS